jgi:hypothetical protein
MLKSTIAVIRARRDANTPDPVDVHRAPGFSRRTIHDLPPV